ncbi:MAG: carbohydrate porin, partial [Alphaproteobacteria bacterium]|nr:carbohydrate porin [Alphaproteobacteria bacterium]
ETFDFTDIDRSLSGGVSISGALWGRAKDQIGIGGALNAISNARANYLAAGGLSILLGDGALSYSGERILETYYKSLPSG